MPIPETMGQLIPIGTLDGFSDQLCDTCKSMFNHKTIQVLVERPNNLSCMRQHLLCAQILTSQRSCHFCAWIVSQSCRFTITSIIEDDDGDIHKDVGGVAFAGAEKDERVFVELTKIAFGIIGLRISSEGA
jgi:hypothetical protein